MKMKNRIVSFLISFALGAIFTADAERTRVYFGTQRKGIYVAELDAETGALSEVKLAIGLSRTGFVAIHPNMRFLYSICDGADDGRNGGVASMKIHPDGTLALLNRQSSMGRGPCYVSIDATGQCLMVANYGSGSVASFRIGEDGSLSEAQSVYQHRGHGTHPTRQLAPHAHSIVPDPENRFVYAPDLGIDKVMIYRLNPEEGTLSESGSAFVPGDAMGPRHMKWSDDGNYAYVLNELDVSLSVFMRGTTPGDLEHITTVPVLPEGADREQMSCAEVKIHPNGRFIYASVRDLAGNGRDALSWFTRYEDGLHRLGTVPAEIGFPRHFNIDPSGRWLLAGGQKSNDLAVFSVDMASGELQFTGRKILFDDGPVCIEFVRRGTSTEKTRPEKGSSRAGVREGI